MRLLVSECLDFSSEALCILRDHFDVQLADLDRGGLIREVRDYEMLWVRLRNMIDAEVMQAAPRLKVVATNTTGLNHIDLDETKRRGISVVSLQGESEFLETIRSTAELTVALTLALMRQLIPAHEHVLGDGWDRTQFKGNDIYRKTVGIIGFGRLGRIVANYFRTMGARVLVHDIRIPESVDVDGFNATSLLQLLSEADIVSLHVNYTSENRHLLGDRELHQMKPGAVLVNTARGELVDQEALVAALLKEKLGGAALDVIDSEHSPSKSFAQLKSLARTSERILLTPHIGGNTVEALERTEIFLAKKLCGLLE